MNWAPHLSESVQNALELNSTRILVSEGDLCLSGADLTPLYLALFISLFFADLAKAKRFQRALVLRGGGISPAVALGVFKGLEDQGWKPDGIITTCGSSVAAALLSAYKTNDAALEYEKSIGFQEVLSHLKVKTVSALRVKRTLSQKSVETEGKHPQFTETYFTDADTALSFVYFRSPIKNIFPKSYLEDFTDAVTDRAGGEAARASIANPFLINPGHLGKDYYFTRAAEKSFNDQNVTFIPSLFVRKRSFDPKSFRSFARKLQAQYDYGYDQVDEVVPKHE